MESIGSYVRSTSSHLFSIALWNSLLTRISSYNKYLSVAAGVVRRSLKESERLKAEKRGLTELRFAKWSVSMPYK
jgi:hypothetical protein